MQNATNEQDTQTRLLSGVWNEQAGPHFDLIILILAVVNVTAACGIISTILYDARVLAKFRSFSTHPYTTSFMGGSRRIIDIHPAEVLPLVLSIATTLQGIVYIIVQIIGLRTLVAKCDTVAQVVWPGEIPLPAIQEGAANICSVVDCTLHNICFRSRDYSAIAP